MQLSRIAFFCCAVLILFTGMFYYPKWSKPGSEATISWDVSGYYMYLPAAFIYKDLKKCAFKDSILAKYQPSPDFQQAFLHPSGNYVMKYPAGQAIMMLPLLFRLIRMPVFLIRLLLMVFLIRINWQSVGECCLLR